MWGPGAQGGFQNALAMGLQVGQMVRQGQDQREYKNALAQFDPSNPETLKPIMAANPEVGLQLKGQVEQRQAAQQQSVARDRDVFRGLLYRARENPEQAYMAAGQMGLQLDGVPPPNSPDFKPWLETEIFIQEALEDPEKLTSVQQDAQALGIDLNTPEGLAAVRELTLYKYAKQGVDEMGRPTLELPTIRLPAPGAQQMEGGSILPRAARPAGMSDDQLFEAARRKVEQGANVDAVFRQLREWGVEVN